MKHLMIAMLGLAAMMSMGCGYAAVAFASEDKVYVARNWIFGADTVYLCKVTPNGLTDCQESPDNP